MSRIHSIAACLLLSTAWLTAEDFAYFHPSKATPVETPPMAGQSIPGQTIAQLDTGNAAAITNTEAKAGLQHSSAGIRIGMNGSTDKSHSFTWNQAFELNEGALEFSFRLKPSIDPETPGRHFFGIALGLPTKESQANRHTEPDLAPIYLELQQHKHKNTLVWLEHNLIHSGKAYSGQGQKRDLLLPYVTLGGDTEAHLVRIVLSPVAEGTRVVTFIDDQVRPVDDEIFPVKVQTGYVGFYAWTNAPESTALLQSVELRKVDPLEAFRVVPSDEYVMRNLNLEHPSMREVARAWRGSNYEEAKRLFIRHMRNRKAPTGPAIKDQYRGGTGKMVADNAVDGKYGARGWNVGSSMSEQFIEDGKIRWDRCTGHFTRHFHWLCLANEWQKSSEEELDGSVYAERLALEVKDYAYNEPYVWWDNPNVANLDWVDGTVIFEDAENDYIYTSNIGRRLELTWWQTFEVIRKAEAFDDEAMFAFLDCALRQIQLIENPSTFAPWDDGGAHTAFAAIKTATMLPEFRRARIWEATGWGRAQAVIERQFHPDGSHVSLSTGYNWPTIQGVEEIVGYMQQQPGVEIPDWLNETTRRMYFHPMMLSRPGFGNIDLNDGITGVMSRLYATAAKTVSDEPAYAWIHAKDHNIEPPSSTPRSIYFPNAGHYVMRTGWSDDDQYLFFGAGPWGASHGKSDGLSIYATRGPDYLLQNAGRGTYGTSAFDGATGKAWSFNTWVPNWAEQSNFLKWEQEKQVGFNPPERPWIQNRFFEYGAGEYSNGWANQEINVQGKQIREVVFVKTENPQSEGYYLVLDTLIPKDNKVHTWRHAWHLGPDGATFNPDGSVQATSKNGRTIRIFPIAPNKELTRVMAREWMEPQVMGWRIKGDNHEPINTPIYTFEGSGPQVIGWVISMSEPDVTPSVTKVMTKEERPGLNRAIVERTGNAKDFVVHRLTGDGAFETSGSSIKGSVAVFQQTGYQKYEQLNTHNGFTPLDTVAAIPQSGSSTEVNGRKPLADAAGLETAEQNIGDLWSGEPIAVLHNAESVRTNLGNRWALLRSDLSGPINVSFLAPNLHSSITIPTQHPAGKFSESLMLDSREYFSEHQKAVAPRLVYYLGKTNTDADLLLGAKAAKRTDNLPGADYHLELYRGTDAAFNGLSALSTEQAKPAPEHGVWMQTSVTATQVPQGTHVYAVIYLPAPVDAAARQTCFADLSITAFTTNIDTSTKSPATPPSAAPAVQAEPASSQITDSIRIENFDTTPANWTSAGNAALHYETNFAGSAPGEAGIQPASKGKLFYADTNIGELDLSKRLQANGSIIWRQDNSSRTKRGIQFGFFDKDSYATFVGLGFHGNAKVRAFLIHEPIAGNMTVVKQSAMGEMPAGSAADLGKARAVPFSFEWEPAAGAEQAGKLTVSIEGLDSTSIELTKAERATFTSKLNSFGFFVPDADGANASQFFADDLTYTVSPE